MTVPPGRESADPHAGGHQPCRPVRGGGRPRGAVLAGACLLGLVGCTGNSGGLAVPIPCADGATYYVILGLGVVAVNDAKPSAAVATGVQSLGLVVSDRPGLRVGLGYTSGSVVAVPDGARDVRIEVSRRPFGPVQVDVQSALLASPTPGAPAEP